MKQPDYRFFFSFGEWFLYATKYSRTAHSKTWWHVLSVFLYFVRKCMFTEFVFSSNLSVRGCC